MIFQTASPEETRAIGQQLARVLKPGDVLCLSGDLGAGKTLFTQGICAGLGVVDAVTSPTFTVLNVYEGTAADGRELSIYHFDLYRLEHPAELAEVGFEHYVEAGGIAIIEWPEKFAEFLPAERLWLTLKPGAADSGRVIDFTPAGERYRALCEELKQVAHTGD